MTREREEQIIEASQLYAKPFQKPFLDGAIWADKHPSEATIRKVIDLYKQWYSQQLDGSVTEYVRQHWREEGDDDDQETR